MLSQPFQGEAQRHSLPTFSQKGSSHIDIRDLCPDGPFYSINHFSTRIYEHYTNLFSFQYFFVVLIKSLSSIQYVINTSQQSLISALLLLGLFSYDIVLPKIDCVYVCVRVCVCVHVCVHACVMVHLASFCIHMAACFFASALVRCFFFFFFALSQCHAGTMEYSAPS